MITLALFKLIIQWLWSNDYSDFNYRTPVFTFGRDYDRKSIVFAVFEARGEERGVIVYNIMCSSIYSLIFITTNVAEHQNVRLGFLISIPLMGLKFNCTLSCD